MKTMKNWLSVITIFALTLTSCQSETDEVFGENPNTNNVHSAMANTMKRTAMHDGSFDDILDGNSCVSVILPVEAMVNGIQVSVINESSYEMIAEILAQAGVGQSEVSLLFPVTVQLSNYTEVVINNQTEMDALAQYCQELENAAQDAISCVQIETPFILFTYNINLEQTGSVVIESQQQLYAFLDTMGGDVLFSVNYPVSITFSNGTSITINSDMEFQQAVSECVLNEQLIEEAEENAQLLQQLLIEAVYEVEALVIAGVDTAEAFAEFTFDFAAEGTVTATNTVNALIEDVEGTYEITSDIEVFLELAFSGNVTFEALNHTWKVTAFTTQSITLQSSTHAGTTLVLTRI